MTDRLHVLTVIYQSERADRSTTLTVSLATMGAAVTYLIGTIAFYDKLDLLGWAITLLPFPLLCIAAFHALLLNLAATRARSILTLEHSLLATAAPGLDHTTIGATATEHATNIHTAPPAIKAATIISYGGIGAIYLAYPALTLAKATTHIHGWILIPATSYFALLIPIALAWKHSTNNLRLHPIQPSTQVALPTTER